MSRIEQRFRELRARDRRALVPYVTAGDPEPTVTVPLLHALVEAGADIIELGVPFSDPMADGPVIQAACERALAHGVSLHAVLDMVREFRRRDDSTPLVLMGYLNPVEVMGYEAFADAAAAAGVDGVLTVDMPPEEGDGLVTALRERALDPIFLIAPNSGEQRVRQLAGAGRGFLYYVAFKGVTGADRLDVDDVARHLERVRALTDLPLGVGFGIRDAAAAAAVARVADAVVVGSALVRRIGELAATPERITTEVPAALAEMRRAMDARNDETAAS